MAGGGGRGVSGAGGGTDGIAVSGLSPATQTTGGTAYTTGTAVGDFGKGGWYNVGDDDPGGGGGWYGGGIARDNAGSGGSGYILTSTSYRPSGYNPNSRFNMTSTQTIAGNSTMPNPSGGTMIGNSGNGYAIITGVN